jgi:acyl-CoA synthetase (AMP-forming)/AMP-acid ligase II
LNDIIIRGGENISAREVEDLLASHPAVAEVAVTPAPDPIWGEVVCAFVLPRAGSAVPDLDALVAHTAAAGLPSHKAPARLVLVDDFPRTAAGKVRKRDLRQRL